MFLGVSFLGLSLLPNPMETLPVHAKHGAFWISSLFFGCVSQGLGTTPEKFLDATIASHFRLFCVWGKLGQGNHMVARLSQLIDF